MRSNLNSTPELEFDEIDLTEIEYKNEYGYGRKAIFGLLGSMGSVALLLNIIPHLGWASGLMVCGSVLSIWALAIAVMMIKIKSTLLITGNGLILKRPLLGDIEIPYSEIGSMEFQDALTRKSSDRGLDIMRLDPSQIESRFGKGNCVVIKSVDRKRTIVIDQTLEKFQQFCSDLATREQLAKERYQGYLRGTVLQQPQRTSNLRAALEEAAKNETADSHSPELRSNFDR